MRTYKLHLKAAIQKTSIYQRYDAWHWRERKISCGKEYPEKTFYVIRRHNIRAGLFSFYLTNLGSVKEALDRGMIPVIDMQSSANPMLAEGEIRHVNAWEKFFLQPCGYGMEILDEAASVVLSRVTAPENFPDYDMLQDEGSIEMWRELAHQYMQLRPEIIGDVDAYAAANLQDRNAVGVLLRGTDYVMTKPKGHPIQPEVPEVVREVREVMQRTSAEVVYLATEDADIWERFRKEFPGRVISYQQHHLTTKAGENVNDVGNRLLSTYERNREYLASIALLSRCRTLIAGAASGTYGALLMSDGFDYCHVYQLGRYE